MINSKQIKTTPNNDEGNKFTFRGMLIYLLYKNNIKNN